MKRLKKWGAALLAAGMILSLTACSQPKEGTTKTQRAAENKEQKEEAKGQSQETAASAGEKVTR